MVGLHFWVTPELIAGKAVAFCFPNNYAGLSLNYLESDQKTTKL